MSRPTAKHGSGGSISIVVLVMLSLLFVIGVSVITWLAERIETRRGQAPGEPSATVLAHQPQRGPEERIKRW